MITYEQIVMKLVETNDTESCGMIDFTIMPISWDNPSVVDEDSVYEMIETWFGIDYFILDGEFHCIGEDDTKFFYSYNDDMFPYSDKVILSDGDDKSGTLIYLYVVE